MKGFKLTKTFYQSEDVVFISKALIGKYLFTQLEGKLTGGMIVETEAYNGVWDKACHAYNHRRTRRTEVMFQPGGVAYVYLCYGIHSLFNIITGPLDCPTAVLIRAIEPTEGINFMMQRRKKKRIDYTLTSGPGAVTQALGIRCEHYGCDLTGDLIWLEDKGSSFADTKLLASPRVGIHYAEEHAELPWRFRLASSPWTSKAK